jgi:cyclopropane-fatty-acyl-phospholipid synthase
MSILETTFTNHLTTADIKVNGQRPSDIQVHDSRLWARVLLQGTVGLGDSYMDGWWDCDDIPELITRLMRAEVDQKFMNIPAMVMNLTQKLYNAQSISLSRRVAKNHYDLGNDLYQKMLDERMVYTCGFWGRGAKI